VFGISDSLDALQEWVTTVRAPIVPQLPGATEGRVVFEEHCSSCHGGAKWTKSRTTPLYALQPATASGLDAVFPENPVGAGFFNIVGGVNLNVKPFDAGLATDGPQIISVSRGQNTLTILDKVGTFFAPGSPQGQLEIRGAAAVAGQSTQGFGAFGFLGFNTPSLLGLSLSAPYLHDGSAATLDAVMDKHTLDIPNGNGGTTATKIRDVVTQQELTNLVNFLRTIEDDTPPVRSATDDFLEQNAP
jgi:cytochrome c peroxidase